MDDNPETGGLSSPSEAAVARMIREGVETWAPRSGPDWPGFLARVAGNGPSPLMLYSVASAALVVILIAAFVVGSYLQIGALAPQPVNTHLP